MLAFEGLFSFIVDSCGDFVLLFIEKEDEKKRLALELETKRKEEEERERKLAEIERKKMEREREIEEKMRKREQEERESRSKDVAKQESKDVWRRPVEDSGSWRKGTGQDTRNTVRDQPPSRG